MKKIIFDLDNTLLYLSSEWVSYVQKFLTEHEINIEPLTLFNAIGKYEYTLTDTTVTKDDLKLYLSNAIAFDINDDIFKDLVKCYNSIPLLYIDKIYEILLSLSKNYELIAYSNWFKEDQEYRLSRYGLDKFFTKVYGWDIVPAKPSLDGLKAIMGDNNPDDFIFVGDNINMDIEKPFEIGMDVIFLNLKGIEQNKYKEIRNIEELIKLLEK